MKKGSRDTPKFWYVLFLSAYALFLPSMVDFNSANILYKRPNPYFGFLTLALVVLQLWVLWR